jgi:hypothetical protein
MEELTEKLSITIAGNPYNMIFYYSNRSEFMVDFADFMHTTFNYLELKTIINCMSRDELVPADFRYIS